MEKLRSGEALSTKDQIINQQELASVVLSLHQQLDAAVADAYGWQFSPGPVGLPESETLTRLVRLNHERAAEEQAGHIRYLRPMYQAPELMQTSGCRDASASLRPDVRREWPKDLAGQMQAVRDVVQQANGPISPTQVAARFGKIRPATVQPLLDTLSVLAMLRANRRGVCELVSMPN